MPRRRTRTTVVALLALFLCAGVALTVVLTNGQGPAARRSSTRARPKRRRPRQPSVVRGRHDRPVPILMYHVISAPQPGAPSPELYTPEPVFVAQMKALQRHGYHAVT